MIRRNPTLFFACFVIACCALLGGLYGAQNRGASAASETEMAESTRNFTRVYSAVEENYADPLNPDKAIFQGAIPGMLRTLDPHSNFFDPKAYTTTREDQRGKYYGVGMMVGPRGGKTIVVEPFVGSPAYRVGIRQGDLLWQVDGKPTDGLTTGEVADMLKGPKGTQVKISVVREGSEKPLDFVVTRDEIPKHAVSQAFEVRPGYAYVKIDTFSSENTGKELSDAFKKLDAKNLKGMVLDLRANPGGLLNEGIAVADMFLRKGQMIVSHRGRNSADHPYTATSGNHGLDFPLVVLMNRNSASASEIVAGAIQDHDRGLIVGETSFGKGLVQTVMPLDDNTALALTTAKYYTPSGRLIQREYNGLSLFDYYYSSQEHERNNTTHEGQQVKNTDSGRIVYGGGGITPDIKLEPIKLNHFQLTLTFKEAFFNFAKRYLATHNTVPRDFQMTDAVMGEFRTFLTTEKIPFTEAEVTENKDFLNRRIHQELISAIYGRIEGDKIAIVNDPWVEKAIEVMPQARDLEDKVKRITAQRMGRDD